MGMYLNALAILFRRTFLLLFFGLLMLVVCFVNYYNPIFTIISGLNSIGDSDIFSNIISFLQMLLNFTAEPSMLPGEVLALAVLLVVLSIAAGLLFSGYFYILNNTLDGKPKYRGEFLAGLKKYFFKLTFISFRVFLLGFMLAIFLMVALVPAIIVTKTWMAGRPQLLFPAILLDILTVAVLLFGLMLFRVYMFFWYPACYNTGKKAFITGKRVADSHFWNTVVSVLMFDIVLAGFQAIKAYIGKTTALKNVETHFPVPGLLIINWAFYTFYFASLTVYIFSLFKAYAAQDAYFAK